VTAGGNFCAESPLTVRGKVTDTKVIRYAPAGTLVTGYSLEFTLREV
jgi:hypothetical protein